MNQYGQVQLWIDDIDECGGTLISLEWVLTAKHCITDNGGTTANSYVLMDDLRLGHGELHTLDYIYPHPTDDVALLHFVAPASRLILTIPYGVVHPSTGQSVLIQGWGDNENGPLQLGDPLQSSNHKIIQYTPDPSIDPDPIWGPIDDYLVAQSVCGLIEEGDSGSGVLTNGLVCGVVHGSNAPDPLSISISTDAVKLWIGVTAGKWPAGRCDVDPTKGKKQGSIKVMTMGDLLTKGYTQGDIINSSYRHYLSDDLQASGLSVELVGSKVQGYAPYDHWKGVDSGSGRG